jgi:putative phosphoesterase
VTIPLEVQVFEQEGIRVGMCHGHTVMPLGNEHALEALRRRMGVDVLLTGGTGRPEFKIQTGGLLVNPGSITGARVSHLATGYASYTLMIMDSGKVPPLTSQHAPQSNCVLLYKFYRQLLLLASGVKRQFAAEA